MKTLCKFEKVSFKEFMKYSDTHPLNKDGYNDISKPVISEYDNIIKPVRSTSGSAGYDFYYPYETPVTIEPGESVVIKSGIKIFIPLQSELYLKIVPRSSYGFKYGVMLANTVGIIDSDYYNNEDNEGHIMIKLTNNGNKPLTISKGDKYCQGILDKYYITEDDCPLSYNRTGGIGSTGK